MLFITEKRLELALDDINQGQTFFRDKLPIPIIRSLSPNYAEANTKADFVVIGENLSYDERARFSDRDLMIQDIQAGPYVEFLISMDVTPGLVRFYWDTAQAEFYVIPPYEGDPSPIIDEIQTSDGNQLLDINAGQRSLTLKIYGYELNQNKNSPVLVPDAAGITTKIKEESVSGNELTATISIDKDIEPGVHSLFVATEGGISNFWIFNVLPPGDSKANVSPNIAIYTSALTLLNFAVVENLLPLIDEDEYDEEDLQNAPDLNNPDINPDALEDEDIPEKARLGPFANVDLETTWLLETTVMIGKITRTVSEVVERKVPKINAALTTNGTVTFNGGSFRIVGASTAMTMLVEPTYLSNAILQVEGPDEEEESPFSDFGGGDPAEKEPPQTPIDLGFTPGSFVAVYKAGKDINELDYALISDVGENTIDLIPPGLKEFHYAEDDVFQFVPPLISKEEVQEQEAERHLVPKDFALTILGAARFRDLFGSNLDQYGELADLYTNDSTIPEDEFELPVGFMGLSYLDSTIVFNEENNLLGKGLLIVDTRRDNLGRPDGTVEIEGDSRSPAEFTGVVYVRGNLRIGGNIAIDGALVVDNSSLGQVEIASNALGMITFNERAIRQTILSIPWTTKPGSVMISSKELELGDYIVSGTDGQQLGATADLPEQKALGAAPFESTDLPPEAALLETEEEPSKAPSALEEELIKFFE